MEEKKEKTIILTVAINETDKSTHIILSDKEGKTMEEFHNKPKKA